MSYQYIIICPCCSNKYRKDLPEGKAFCTFCQAIWDYKAQYQMGNSIHSFSGKKSEENPLREEEIIFVTEKDQENIKEVFSLKKSL